MANNNRLGKGLGAIFGDDVSNILEEIQQGNREDLGHKTQLPIDDVRPNPYQPRRYFDEVKLGELAESIRQHGLFTPVLVREAKSGYELVAGERRLRASKIAGLEFIEAIVVEFNDEQMMEIAIIENIQREDLNVLEEAQGYAYQQGMRLCVRDRHRGCGTAAWNSLHGRSFGGGCRLYSAA